MTARATIREADAKRLFRAGKAAGFANVRITLTPDGSIVCDASNDTAQAPLNSFDKIMGNKQ